MSKGHLPVIAKITNPTTLGAVHIMSGALEDGTIGSVSAGVGAVRITRAQLVSLRDQIDAWLDAHSINYPPGMGEESRRLHREYNALVEAQRNGEKNGADVVRVTDECNAKGIILVPGGENL